MKFLIDECVGHGIAQWLQDQGYDAISILEVSPGISDDEVLNKAFNEDRILVTMDKDFGDIVFRSNKNHCGIILLRLSNWHKDHKISVLGNVLSNHGHELTGNFIVATEQAIRIVRLTKIH